MHLRMLVTVAITLAGAMTFTGPAQSQLREALDEARPNCKSVATAGNRAAASIQRQMNRYMRGRTHKINRRKTLRINRIGRVRFVGCQALVRAHVTLKRRVRRDAHGTMVMSSRVTRHARGRLCLSAARVHEASLSRTWKIGERYFRFLANFLVPGKERCFRV